MFGYININKQELKIKDYELYRAYYCGVCDEIRKNTGPHGRIVLSFDMTFLAMLLDGLYDDETKIVSKRCLANPVIRHKAIAGNNVKYAADMNLLLSYENMKDKWYDSKNLFAFVYALIIKHKTGKIKKAYACQAKAVDNYITELHKIENEKNPDFEAAANLTGRMLGEIYAKNNDEWSEILRGIGFYMGKFVYFADAYCDYEKDKKSGSYNPFVLNNNDVKTYGKKVLKMMAAEVARLFEILPVVDNMEILRNIIYSGMFTRINETYEKEKSDDGSIQSS